jgi:hypothetical protein
MPRGKKFTSPQPLPPSAFSTPHSNVNDSPVGSASAGVGWPSIRQRSMRCSWQAARSARSARFQELGGDVLRHGRKCTLPRPGGATLDAAALDRASRVHGRTAVYAPL